MPFPGPHIPIPPGVREKSYDMHQHALTIIFTSDNANIPGYYDRLYGFAVRLVRQTTTQL